MGQKPRPLTSEQQAHRDKLTRQVAAAKRTAEHPRTEEALRFVSLQMQARLEGLLDQLSTDPKPAYRREWAALPGHAEAFPDHIAVCGHCARRYDRHVEPLNGMHHTRRPADYCSDSCQEAAKEARKRHAIDAERERRFFEADTKLALSKVRAHYARESSTLVASRSEWNIIERGAPDIARGLHFYDRATLARDVASRGAARLGRVKTEALRKELVEAIDQWLREHQPEED